MPIIVTTNTNTGMVSGCAGIYPTAQLVVDSCSTDLLQRIAPEDPVLLDYINRVQLQLLRVSRWKFLKSPLQSFVTRIGRSDYWIGPAGSGPLDVVDTGLNISNLGPIDSDSIYDRTNFRLLKRINEQILGSAFAFRDGSSRLGPPREFRVDPSTPCTINLYPAPDNQNNFQPVPENPAVSAVAGGALPARVYWIRTTFVDSLGNESAASSEAYQFVPAGSLLVVQPPQEVPSSDTGIQYNRYNVYIYNAGLNDMLTTGSETLVTQGGPLSTAVAYQEPTTGFLTGGLSFPTANNVAQMGGYLIQFRYYQAKPQVTALVDMLLIPSDYFDVLVAGVNYFTAQFLKDESAQQYWKQEYDNGITGMIRDKNLFPKGPQFMSPDATSQGITNNAGYETETNFQNNNGWY
jgi:hypothetical protein